MKIGFHFNYSFNQLEQSFSWEGEQKVEPSCEIWHFRDNSFQETRRTKKKTL